MSSLCICCWPQVVPRAEAWRRRLSAVLPATRIDVVAWQNSAPDAVEWPVDGYVLWLADTDHPVPSASDWLLELERRRTVLVVALPPEQRLPASLAHVLTVPWPAGAEEPELLPFLRRELEPVLEDPRLRSGEESGSGALSRRELRLAATRCLPEDGILGFFFDQRLDPDSIGGGNLQERLLRFLHLVDRRDLMAAFADFLADEYGPCVERALRGLKAQPAWKVWF